MSKNDSDTTVQELKDLIVQFRDERGWAKHHTPKNLAISIAVEAAELLEHFQWDEYKTRDPKEIADELADILSYCLNFADTMNIDIAEAFTSKLGRVKKKFPVELFNPEQTSSEEYLRIKKEYREKGDSK